MKQSELSVPTLCISSSLTAGRVSCLELFFFREMGPMDGMGFRFGCSPQQDYHNFRFGDLPLLLGGGRSEVYRSNTLHYRFTSKQCTNREEKLITGAKKMCGHMGRHSHIYVHLQVLHRLLCWCWWWWLVWYLSVLVVRVPARKRLVL